MDDVGGTVVVGYPRLLRRLQGAFIDGLIIPIAVLATIVALAYAGVESWWIKVGVPVLVVLLLEPVAVSMTGGSPGHHLVGLRVRKENSDQRIGLVAAIVRLFVKTLFGIPAFFVAFITRKRQALHDLAAHSLIVHKATQGLPSYELVPERTPEDEQATYVSVWRRLLVIGLYWILFYFAWSISVYALFAGPCIDYGQCTKPERYMALGAVPALLVVVIVLAIQGWRGRLFGARKPRARTSGSA